MSIASNYFISCLDTVCIYVCIDWCQSIIWDIILSKKNRAPSRVTWPWPSFKYRFSNIQLEVKFGEEIADDDSDSLHRFSSSSRACNVDLHPRSPSWRNTSEKSWYRLPVRRFHSSYMFCGSFTLSTSSMYSHRWGTLLRGTVSSRRMAAAFQWWRINGWLNVHTYIHTVHTYIHMPQQQLTGHQSPHAR